MSIVKLNNVTLNYPIYSMRAQSIRNSIANIVVGGKLLKDKRDIVHVKALDKISFSLDSGERLGLFGHNGSGKSTLLKVLAGVYEPDSGDIEIKGRISSMLDITLGVDPELTGIENVLTMGRLRGYTTRQMMAKMPEIVDFSDLGQFIDLPMKTYSAGMYTRLVFAVATSLEPDILLMDEWIGAGDAAFFEKAKARINGILAKSRIMVLATHSPNLIKETCTKVLVLESGKAKFFGDVNTWYNSL